jgi:2-methylcitrate dehydratase PrpD
VSGFSLGAAPPAVSAQATLLTLDTLGSCLASSRQDFGRSVTEAAVRLGGAPESVVIGSKARIGAAAAALANGTLAHGLDFDDTREDAIVHTGCVAVTTALAVGEAVEASGRAARGPMRGGGEPLGAIPRADRGRFREGT